MSSWNTPEAITRTGASHARRGVVCQDASGRYSLLDRRGQPVHLMVVADGHGGQRYTHSHVGSRLACELSLNLIEGQLGQWASIGRGARERWQQWLEATFPTSLHQRWLAAVESHWRQENIDKDAAEAPFSPLAYGTTIALVMMTPTWWGHTGLGDWDLVRIGSDGEVELVNEEQEEDQTGGEATYSLCLNNAPKHFAARTAVHPITEQQPTFSLVLSTDGVRKSCSTDADFFAIARYLCEAEQPRNGDAAAQLNADLDRISSQGSGDDVSVAIGRWLLIREKSHQPGGARRRDKQLQRSKPLIVQPRKKDASHGTNTTAPAGNMLPDHGGGVNRAPAIAGDQGLEPKTPTRVPWLVLGILLSAAGLGVAGMALLAIGPFSRGDSRSAEPSLELVAVLRKQADELCKQPIVPITGHTTEGPSYKSRDANNLQGDDNGGAGDGRERIESNDESAYISSGIMEGKTPPGFTVPISPAPLAESLYNSLYYHITSHLGLYKKQFDDMASRKQSPDQFLANPSQDPLAALIAWSLQDPNLKELMISIPDAIEAQSRLLDLLPRWIRPSSSTPSRGSPYVPCPELARALEKQWRRAKSEAAEGLRLGEPTRRTPSSSQKSTTPPKLDLYTNSQPKP